MNSANRPSEVNNILNSIDMSLIEYNGEQESIMTNDFNLTKASVFNRNLNFNPINPIKGPMVGKSNIINQPRESDAGMTVMQKYKHKGANSLYFIQPKSQNIFILDFKRQAFIMESLQSQILMPSAF